MNNLNDVAICNLGLGWVGANLITSFADQSVEAQLCKGNYAALRDAVLEGYEWTFAQKRFVPPKLSTSPAWGYKNQFEIPADILRVHYVGQSTNLEENDPVEWVREGDAMLADALVIYVRGTMRLEDYTKFSPMFAQALAARVGWELAMPLTNSKGMAGEMKDNYLRKVAEAERIDGKQGRSRVIRAPGLLIARRSGTTSIGPTV